MKLVLAFLLALTGSAGLAAPEGKPEAAFKFGGIEYLSRWSKDD